MKTGRNGRELKGEYVQGSLIRKYSLLQKDMFQGIMICCERQCSQNKPDKG